jgi:hypothetical protein
MIPLRAFCGLLQLRAPPRDLRERRAVVSPDPRSHRSHRSLGCLLGVENCRRFAENKKYRGANRGVEPKNAKTKKSAELCTRRA